MGRAGAATIIFLVATVFARPAGAEQRSAKARGEYLARQVARCVECHTPRDESGRLVESRLFFGARIPVAKPEMLADWALEAPALAGLAAVSREMLIGILTTGRTAEGHVLRPPMPEYRLSKEDAAAIADYLASLPAPVR